MEDIAPNARLMGAGGMATSSKRTMDKGIPLIHVSSAVPKHDTRLDGPGGAFVLAYQRGMRSSDVWVRGRRHPASFERGTFAMVDLRDTAIAHMQTSFGWLHFVVPNPVLDGIAALSRSTCSTKMIPGRRTGVVDPIAEDLMTCVLKSLGGLGTPDLLMIDHLVLALQVHLARTYGRMAPELPEPGKMEPAQIRIIKDLLADKLQCQVSLASLAADMGMDRRAFTAAFHDATGYTPQAWRGKYRILMAKSLLQDQSLSLAEVAITCGFADQSHFTRVFKRFTEYTPGAWRVTRHPRAAVGSLSRSEA